MTTNKLGDLQVPARREGAGKVEGFGEQGDAHGEVGNFLNTLRKIVILINIFRFFQANNSKHMLQKQRQTSLISACTMK